MSDGDGESSDRTAPGTEEDEGVKVSIPDDFSDSTASPVRDFTPPSVRSVCSSPSNLTIRTFVLLFVFVVWGFWFGSGWYCGL